MLSAHLKPSVVRFITPLCRILLRIGITPNLMTLFGTAIVFLGSIFLLAQGKLLASLIIIGIALLTDLLDGTMARISDQGPSKWGSFLDSTLDRIADGSIFLALAYFLETKERSLALLVVLTFAISTLVPYARAKAESLGIECKGGFAERPERLLILGVAGALYIAGLEQALTVGIWILFITSLFTVLQRTKIVWSATR